jgi:uracil-DNA glycosylase family 4
MFIASHPTEMDDETGEPMSDELGVVLDYYLNRADIPRESVFIDHLIACRPCTQNEDGQLVDRKPTKREITLCRPRLEEAIYAVDPQVIVALGGLVLTTLTSERGNTAKLAGAIYETRIGGWVSRVPYPVFAMLSPRYLLKQTVNAEKIREETWEHFEGMLRILRIVQEDWEEGKL